MPRVEATKAVATREAVVEEQREAAKREVEIRVGPGPAEAGRKAEGVPAVPVVEKEEERKVGGVPAAAESAQKAAVALRAEREGAPVPAIPVMVLVRRVEAAVADPLAPRPVEVEARGLEVLVTRERRPVEVPVLRLERREVPAHRVREEPAR